MHVAADLQEVALFFNQVGLEPALEQVAAATMPPIEITREAAVKIMHTVGEVCLGRLDEQMVVIRHQHEAVQPPAVDLDGPPEPLDPLLPVGVVANDPSPLVATRRQVIQCPREIRYEVVWPWPDSTPTRRIRQTLFIIHGSR